jgi:hypothetical protein
MGVRDDDAVGSVESLCILAQSDISKWKTQHTMAGSSSSSRRLPVCALECECGGPFASTFPLHSPHVTNEPKTGGMRVGGGRSIIE